MDEVAYKRHWASYYEDKAKAAELMESLSELVDSPCEDKHKLALRARLNGLLTEDEYRILKEFYP